MTAQHVHEATTPARWYTSPTSGKRGISTDGRLRASWDTSSSQATAATVACSPGRTGHRNANGSAIIREPSSTATYVPSSCTSSGHLLRHHRVITAADSAAVTLPALTAEPCAEPATLRACKPLRCNPCQARACTLVPYVQTWYSRVRLFDCIPVLGRNPTPVSPCPHCPCPINPVHSASGSCPARCVDCGKRRWTAFPTADSGECILGFYSRQYPVPVPGLSGTMHRVSRGAVPAATGST
jgi:hypothetical protein